MFWVQFMSWFNFPTFFKIEYLVDLRLNATFTILNCVNIFFFVKEIKRFRARKKRTYLHDKRTKQIDRRHGKMTAIRISALCFHERKK